MQDAQVKRQSVQVDNLIDRVPLGPVHFINGGQERPALHFDIRVSFAEENVH